MSLRMSNGRTLTRTQSSLHIASPDSSAADLSANFAGRGMIWSELLLHEAQRVTPCLQA